MPEISLLEPTVLNGVISKFTAPPQTLAQSLFKRESYPFPVAEWDVIQGSREKAAPTMPNREGKLVNQMGVGKKTATFIYTREKKAFEPTTLHWLREPGTLATANAEASVRREAADLNNRVERFVEWACWEALKGEVVIDEPDVKATIDYGLDATHTPLAGTLWSEAEADIIGNVEAWKKLISQDAEAVPTTVYLNSNVMKYLRKNDEIKEFFVDSMREEVLRTGRVTGLLGLNWQVFDAGYVDNTGTFVTYLPDTHIIMVAGSQPEAFKLLEGPSADDEAPRGTTGKFSKTWKTSDPSGRFILLEYHFVPAILQPDCIVYAEVVAS